MSYFVKYQKYSLIQWRLCITIFMIILSTSFCKSIINSFGAQAFSLSSPASSSSQKTLDHEIGSPLELAWQAWLLVDNKSNGQTAIDSANILRRITPKSIFIAPELISCPNGYTSDGKGICKPIPIKIDEDAQRQFFLKRLNALYGKFSQNRKKPADATGPLQINIPISLPIKSNTPEIKLVQQELHQESQKVDKEITKNPVQVSVEILHSHIKMHNDNDNKDYIPTVVYNINDTNKKQKEILNEQGISIFLKNPNISSSNKDFTYMNKVTPMGEIFEEMNNTFSNVLNYKIPINLKDRFNKSDIINHKNMNTNIDQFHMNLNEENVSDNLASKVMLLFSPTGLPFNDTLNQTKPEFFKSRIFIHSLVDYESKQIQNLTILSTENQTKLKFSTIKTIIPLTIETTVNPINITIENTEKTQIKENKTIYTDEETQIKEELENHDGSDDKSEVNQADLNEMEDELLTPREVDSMIPHNNPDFVRYKNHEQYLSLVTDEQMSTSTLLTDTTIIPTLSTINIQNSFDDSNSMINTDSVDYLKKDTATTETTEFFSTLVTSESNLEETTVITKKRFIKKDVIQENFMKSPIETISKTNREIISSQQDIKKPILSYSTQRSSYNKTSDDYTRKTENVAKILSTPFFEEFQESITKTEPTPFSHFHRDDSSNQKDKKLFTLNINEPIFFKNHGNIPSDFKDQISESSKLSNKNFGQVPSQNNEKSFFRFSEEKSETLFQRRNCVRFPSDEVNIIHNQDNYKDHLLSSFHSTDEYKNNLSTSTKSSASIHQMYLSTNWKIPIYNMRMDRQYQQPQQKIKIGSNISNYRQQKRKPVSLQFRGRMPLIRNLTLYTTSHGSYNVPSRSLDNFH